MQRTDWSQFWIGQVKWGPSLNWQTLGAGFSSSTTHPQQQQQPPVQQPPSLQSVQAQLHAPAMQSGRPQYGMHAAQMGSAGPAAPGLPVSGGGGGQPPASSGQTDSAQAFWESLLQPLPGKPGPRG